MVEGDIASGIRGQIDKAEMASFKAPGLWPSGVHTPVACRGRWTLQPLQPHDVQLLGAKQLLCLLGRAPLYPQSDLWAHSILDLVLEKYTSCSYLLNTQPPASGGYPPLGGACRVLSTAALGPQDSEPRAGHCFLTVPLCALGWVTGASWFRPWLLHLYVS